MQLIARADLTEVANNPLWAHHIINALQNILALSAHFFACTVLAQ